MPSSACSARSQRNLSDEAIGAPSPAFNSWRLLDFPFWTSAVMNGWHRVPPMNQDRLQIIKYATWERRTARPIHLCPGTAA